MKAEIIEFDKYRPKAGKARAQQRAGSVVKGCTNCGCQNFIILDVSLRFECDECGTMIDNYKATKIDD